jgi:hypothetical protein
MGPLKNAKHEAFCRAYVRGETAGNATAAYKLVYRRQDRAAASRLHRRDDILQRVAKLQQQQCNIEQKALERAAEALAVDKEWVLKQLVENVERAMQAQAVLNSEGEKTGEYRYDGATANRALELIGKHFGMFVERREITQKVFDVSPEPLSGLASQRNVRRWQHRLTQLWSKISGGCHLDRPIADLIVSAGFRVETLDTGYAPGPKMMAFMSEGSARPG